MNPARSDSETKWLCNDYTSVPLNVCVCARVRARVCVVHLNAMTLPGVNFWKVISCTYSDGPLDVSPAFFTIVLSCNYMQIYTLWENVLICKYYGVLWRHYLPIYAPLCPRCILACRWCSGHPSYSSLPAFQQSGPPEPLPQSSLERETERDTLIKSSRPTHTKKTKISRNIFALKGDIVLPGMNMGGTLVSYWWVLGFWKAVLHTTTTDWWVLGQCRVTATISASTWSTNTCRGKQTWTSYQPISELSWSTMQTLVLASLVMKLWTLPVLRTSICSLRFMHF